MSHVMRKPVFGIGKQQRRIRSEVPSRFGKKLFSSGILTRNPGMQSWDCSEAKFEAYYISIIQ